jgi:radical SAM superfamily enzyme YgiQ (UPF0313 family)
LTKLKLIYPKWAKLERQTEFHLPPHAPVVLAAAVPPEVEIDFIDENVEELKFEDDADFIGISMMLTGQVKRGWEIADKYRKMGKKVIFGGIATMLHSEETQKHADSVFLGEIEGRFKEILDDFKNNRLKPVYDYFRDYPDITKIGPANRNILKRKLYEYKGTPMPDLFHASRGCRYNCYPCCVSFLGGRNFRPRPYDKVVEELETIENKKLFIVDNTLAQDTKWEMELFDAIKPLKKRWVSHPLEDNDKLVKAAADSGCWYVYQAVFDTSDYIRNRIKRLKDNGIGVEGTILLGLDEHTEDSIKRLIDFLLEIDLDLAEFTILTPFPHTRVFDDMHKTGRITSYDWNDYTADKVVYKPKNISPEKLQELYYYAWDAFYKDEPQSYKMFRLFKKL